MTPKLDGKLVLVGAGKMGGTLLLGMLKRGLDANVVSVEDPNPPDDIASALADYGVRAIPATTEVPKPAQIVILAVKPQLMQTVAPKISERYVDANTLVVSIADGLTLKNLQALVRNDTAIVRAMPNTPAAIGQAMTVCVANERVRQDQRDLCDALMRCAGETAWLTAEADMDAVTAVSGSGPAYIFHLAECLAQAGIEAGLDASLAHKLARETIAGAGALLRASPDDAATLRTNVTSKGGTTAAALDVLMNDKDGLSSLMTRAVTAAANRSRELAKGE